MFNFFRHKKYTYIVPVGKSLGDNILFDSFVQYYRAIFPYENIVVLDSAFDEIKNAKKIVINKDGAIINTTQCKGVEIFSYDLFDSMRDLAKTAGVYPSFHVSPIYKPETLDFLKENSYIILYLRNIKKAQGKNISESIALNIYKLLSKSNIVILIGNDADYNCDNDFKNIINKKKQLSVNQIAWLCNNCKLFIGSDGGIVHLAAASGCKNMITFNYTDKKYFPITKNSSRAFLRNEYSKFIEYLEKYINDNF